MGNRQVYILGLATPLRSISRRTKSSLARVPLPVPISGIQGEDHDAIGLTRLYVQHHA